MLIVIFFSLSKAKPTLYIIYTAHNNSLFSVAGIRKSLEPTSVAAGGRVKNSVRCCSGAPGGSDSLYCTVPARRQQTAEPRNTIYSL